MHLAKGKNEIKPIDYLRREPFFVQKHYDTNLLDAPCNNYRCKRCRPKLQIKLQCKFLDSICRNEMKYHGVITFPGRPLRLRIPYWKSYTIMSKEVNKLNKTIRRDLDAYKQGIDLTKLYGCDMFFKPVEPTQDLDYHYIRMARSQNHPFYNNPIGMCHFHNFWNLPLNEDYLNEVIKQNNYLLGGTNVTENPYAYDYLINDFMDDEEWVIPKGIRHFVTDRSAVMNDISSSAPVDGTQLFRIHDTNVIDTILADTHVETYQCFGHEIKTLEPRTLPYHEYIKKYQELHQNEWWI